MPDFKSNNTFKLPDLAKDYNFTPQGNLQIPFERLIDLDINVESIQLIDDPFEAKDEYGNLRENVVEEEIRIQVFLDNITEVSDETFKFYYKYEVPPVVTEYTYLPINVELVNGDNFCQTNNREQRTLYVKNSDLNIFQYNFLNSYKKVFNEILYSNDRGVPWNGKFNNGVSANYVAFTDSTDVNSYYRVQAVQGNERNETIQEEGTGDGTQFKFVNEVFGCSPPPEVNPVQLYITPKILIPGGRESAICFGTTRSSIIPQRKQITAYIQGNTNEIADKILYASNGIDPLDISLLNFGPGQNAVTVRLADGEQQPYYSIEYVQNLTNGKYGAKISETQIGTCPVLPSEPTDCDKLDNNIPPTSSNETIICRGNEYEWDGSIWKDISKKDDEIVNPNEGLEFDDGNPDSFGGGSGGFTTGGGTPFGGPGGSRGGNESIGGF